MKTHESRGVKCWGRNFACKDKQSASHLLLNDGLLKVDVSSDEQYHSGFLDDLGRDIDRGIMNYIGSRELRFSECTLIWMCCKHPSWTKKHYGYG